jgi:SAM-dependent methyltransferase
MRKDIEQLRGIYAASLASKGVTPEGVLWPNAPDLATRFEVLLSPIEFAQYTPTNPVRLVDLGCGPGFLLDYLAENDLLGQVDYTGVDVIETTLQHAHRRWPQHRFELRDVRDRPFNADMFDYCIICGVFTARFRNSHADMERLVCETLRAIWPSVRLGLGFNVMSKHVDWERDDLFHWPLDDILAFCKANLSRHVSLRLDYGLWEASALVRKTPVARSSKLPAQWGPAAQPRPAPGWHGRSGTADPAHS